MLTLSALGNRHADRSRGERRPADVIGAAIMVAKIATGEVVEHPKAKSGRIRSGRAGAQARAKVSAAERGKIAKKAATKRWDS